MAKISLICEQCGGNIVLDNSHEIGTCESCFAQFVVKHDQIIQKITQNITKYVYGYQGKDVEELLIDAYNLLNIGNEYEANAKFKRAIDIDPKCWNAWLGYADSLPGNYEYLLTKVDAYRSAYDVATSEKEQMDTYIDMIGYLPDPLMRSAFVRAFNLAAESERRNLFHLVSGVIGCDESEMAALAIDLCPNDWRTHFAKAKFRQIRARWAEVKGIFRPHLPAAALEVLDIFVHAYNIAKSENDIQGMDTIKEYVQDLGTDNSYRTFANEVLRQMK